MIRLLVPSRIQIMNEATKQEPGAVEALLLPFKDSHSLAFTLLPKARTIDQQIADLTREVEWYSQQVTACTELLDAAERERDAYMGEAARWAHRYQLAEHERDEWQNAAAVEAVKANAARAERDAAREALAQVPCSMGTFNDAGEWERCVDWIARLKREDAGDGLPHPWCAALREQPTDTAEGD
jgi:hypothetical protein